MAIVKQRAANDIAADFKFQSQRDDCWSVCLHNILKELATRKDRPSLRLSEARLNRAMGYGGGGYGALSIRIDRVRPNINRLISMSGYLLIELAEVSLAGLREITDDEGLSFPIAGLSYQFLRDKRQAGSRLTFEEEPPVGIDHSVVVLDVSEEKVVVFDPLERFSRGGKGGDGIITVSGPSFLAYWSQASVDRQWLMYAAPIVKKGVRTLDEYKGKEDENQN